MITQSTLNGNFVFAFLRYKKNNNDIKKEKKTVFLNNLTFHATYTLYNQSRYLTFFLVYIIIQGRLLSKTKQH